jgi:AcrR family transcriptional regulator
MPSNAAGAPVEAAPAEAVAVEATAAEAARDAGVHNAGARAKAPRPCPRDRLLKAADELFYAEGVHSVGIDRVIERADVARASLYSNFGSKDELVRAYLEQRMEASTTRLRTAIAAHSDPRERLLSVFDAQDMLFTKPDFRGCAFNRATAEARPGSAADEVSQAYRRWLRNLFEELAAAAGAPDPVMLGRQIQVLYDGGMLAASQDHDTTIAAASRGAGAARRDAALASAATA